MLKSRRGLLAAGLAVAVVGAIGVVSTVNAGADQIASPPEASSAPAAAGADADATEIDPADITPPARLPWGDPPRRIKKGRDGATSKTLRAQGLSAAPPDASGSLAPRGKHGPKGRSGGRSGVIRSQQTTIAPPKPPGVKQAAAAANDVNYLYNVGSQDANSAGVFANVTIGKPELAKKDYHSLAEIALQSADGEQIVEVGWTVDRVVNGDDDPHLFVFHWVNDVPKCYNDCGFVQVSPNIKPGATLTYGVTKKFGIQYFNNAWWVAYDTEWVGFFPEKIWNDAGVQFDRSGYVQVFGEIAAAQSKPCTDMGNGTAPDTEDSAAARFSSVGYVDGPSPVLFMRSTVPDQYAVAKVMDKSVTPWRESTRSFRYGGPGRAGC
ncbi:neprosin family prolyl endopeptidase [Actinoplanes sp. M2I2]|uniref:neprosin family prolyl endopeptidase n=1 Tax=Actinoplanes sp. M2I2 TaxID=1734444 RepID=UPI0020217E35|nr:neprosin family prolyl endopeptidase [Actinoplanes sp. M2I2]